MHKFLTKKNDILAWLDEHDKHFKYYGEEALTIDSKGQVSSKADIQIDTSEVEYLAVKFKKVEASFTLRPGIENNKFKKGILKSLAGCPEEVWGNFDCSRNKLKNLVGGPVKVDCQYICFHNQIKNLKGIPKKVFTLQANNNCLSNLKYFPKIILTSANLYENPITDFDGLVDCSIAKSIAFDRITEDTSGKKQSSLLVMSKEELIEYLRAHRERDKIGKAINVINANEASADIAGRFKV